jgi:hypothetical protein
MQLTAFSSIVNSSLVSHTMNSLRKCNRIGACSLRVTVLLGIALVAGGEAAAQQKPIAASSAGTLVVPGGNRVMVVAGIAASAASARVGGGGSDLRLQADPALALPPGVKGPPFGINDGTPFNNTTNLNPGGATVPAIADKNNVAKIGSALSRAYPDLGFGMGFNNDLKAGQSILYRVAGPVSKLTVANAAPPKLQAQANAGDTAPSKGENPGIFPGAKAFASQVITRANANDPFEVDGVTKSELLRVTNFKNPLLPAAPNVPIVPGFAVGVVHDPVTVQLVNPLQPAGVELSIGGASAPALRLSAPDPGAYAMAFYEIGTGPPGQSQSQSPSLELSFSVAIDYNTQALSANLVNVTAYDAAAFQSEFGFNSQSDFVKYLLGYLTLNPQTHTLTSKSAEIDLFEVMLDSSSPVTVTFDYGTAVSAAAGTAVSSTAVPEPSTLVLGSIALLSAMGYVWALGQRGRGLRRIPPEQGPRR